MSPPTISIIMSNYNHGHCISQALEAILSQSFRPLELIVIDDASTDNSVEIIRQFVNRDSIVRLIQNQRNMGNLYNVNKYLHHVCGDYVYSASADDKVLPGLFEKSMSLLSEHPQAALCCSDTIYEYLDRPGLFIHDKIVPNTTSIYITPIDLVRLMRQKDLRIAGMSVIFKKSALIDSNSFNPALRWDADWFASYTIGFRHGICYIPQPLSIARISSNSYSAQAAKQPQIRQEILSTMIQLLKSPSCRDVLPFFQRSAILSRFQLDAIRALSKHPENWKLFSALLLRRVLLREGIGLLSRITPAPLKHIYHRIRDRDKKMDSAIQLCQPHINGSTADSSA